MAHDRRVVLAAAGPHAGRLFTHAPSTYKIPTSVDIPHIFNVKLFNNQNQADTIYRSKAVGEPPFMLALSVFSAIRQAVQAAIPENAPLVLNAPATPEEILRAIAIGGDKLWLLAHRLKCRRLCNIYNGGLIL